jgi:hypothetical protein
LRLINNYNFNNNNNNNNNNGCWNSEIKRRIVRKEERNTNQKKRS